MEKSEEGLRNIDVFLRTLVKKIAEDDDCYETNKVEPIESLLRKKYIIEKHSESNPSANNTIPLPQTEEPLIDVFEDDKCVRILMQHRCNNEKVVIHTDADGLEICSKERGKLKMPMKHLQVENMIVRCNNEVLEINIPKMKLSLFSLPGFSKCKQCQTCSFSCA
jgi:hypothetical protein